MGWIHLDQYGDRWRALVNTDFHKMSGNSSVSERLMASEGLSSMKFVTVQGI
jgi:hypothetical protein